MHYYFPVHYVSTVHFLQLHMSHIVVSLLLTSYCIIYLQNISLLFCSLLSITLLVFHLSQFNYIFNISSFTLYQHLKLHISLFTNSYVVHCTMYIVHMYISFLSVYLYFYILWLYLAFSLSLSRIKRYIKRLPRWRRHEK